MIDVVAYHVLFPVQGGMWTGYSQFWILCSGILSYSSCRMSCSWL